MSGARVSIVVHRVPESKGYEGAPHPQPTRPLP